jgi:hypothetical protein
MRPRSGLLVAVAAYAALTIVLTWPLARGLARDLPADFGDPLLNCWVLAWDAEHLLRGLAGHVDALREYWNANIYYPHPLSLAYSEHLTAQALAILPVYALTGNPILCYNVIFLLTFVLSAVGMFLLVRELTGSGLAGFLAGVAYGFAPYRFGTLPHVQVLSSMWMPFVLLGFHRFLGSGRLGPLVGASSAWIAQNLSCGYYFLFFSPVVALYLAIEITRRRLWSDRVVLTRVAGAMAIVGIVTLPFLLPYWQLRQLGFGARSLTETTRYSADVLAYFTADVGMHLWGRLVRAWPKPEGSLFPGFTIALLAGLGIVQPWLQARHESSGMVKTGTSRVLTWLLVIACGVTTAILVGWSLHVTIASVDLRVTSLTRGLTSILVLAIALLALSRRSREIAVRWVASPVGTLSIVTAFAFVMSLGPEIFAGGRLVEDANVYSLFYDFVPGFDGLRVPARYAMIVALGLAALAGHGAASIASRRHGALVVALATVFMIAESWAAPISLNVNSTEYKQPGLVPLPDTLSVATETPAVYRFVSSLPASSALIELPFGEVAFETRYMYYSTRHWRRLVNGYSGGGPDDYGLWTERFKEIVSRPDLAWQAVLDSHASHIIVHEGSYAGGRGRLISDWAVAHGAQEIGTFDSDRIFAVP